MKDEILLAVVGIGLYYLLRGQAASAQGAQGAPIDPNGQIAPVVPDAPIVDNRPPSVKRADPTTQVYKDLQEFRQEQAEERERAVRFSRNGIQYRYR